MRFFVTGATGFIGGRVARQLVGSGHDVVTVARRPENAIALSRLGVEVHGGDLTDKENMRAPMKGADGVFHVAGWYKVGERDKSAAYGTNVEGTRNVLELMKELEIPKGIYTSTLAVFGDTKGRVVDETYRHDGPWLSEYDRTKWVAHYEIAEPMIRGGLPLVIVQPGVTYGPGDTGPIRPFFVQYLQRKLRAIPKKSTYCWGHVDDVARAHILAMEKGRVGESYIVAGEPLELSTVFGIAEKITGIPAPRLHVSPLFVKFLAALTRSERLRVSAGVTYLGSNAKAKRELDLRHRPLRDGLQETLDHEKRLLNIG